MKKTALGICACMLAAALASGCASSAKFVYPDKMSSLATCYAPVASSGRKVAVLPFEDFRSDENQTAAMSLYYLPLSPFGYIECERPETGSRFVSIDSFNFTPSEDLAKAAALSLSRSGLFADAFFTFGGEKGSADLILDGKIESTYFKGRLFSYGVSIYSCYLWVLGAPCGTSLNRLSLHLSLKSAKSGKVLWEGSFEKEDYIVQWIYARRGQDAKLYASLMREGMNEALKNLTDALRANPALLSQ